MIDFLSWTVTQSFLNVGAKEVEYMRHLSIYFQTLAFTKSTSTFIKWDTNLIILKSCMKEKVLGAACPWPISYPSIRINLKMLPLALFPTFLAGNMRFKRGWCAEGNSDLTVIHYSHLQCVAGYVIVHLGGELLDILLNH